MEMEKWKRARCKEGEDGCRPDVSFHRGFAIDPLNFSLLPPPVFPLPSSSAFSSSLSDPRPLLLFHFLPLFRRLFPSSIALDDERNRFAFSFLQSF